MIFNLKNHWIFLAIKSRFITNSNEIDFVIERRKICKDCELNSKNKKTDKTLKQKIFKILSDFLTFITFSKDKEDLGQCLHIDCGCDLYQKSKIDSEICYANKWKQII